jgi:N-methylhydantoinase B
MSELDSVDLGILWDRLISITDEIVSALVRSSFSTIVRESGDLSCVLFDADGNSLAQGTYSVPSFTGTAPVTLRHMLKRFPPETLEPGDVVITNDPWMGTGHLFDVSVMRPVFRGDRNVGFTLSVTHLADIGGIGFTTTTTEIFEEGIQIPITKLVRRGKLNDELMELILKNVRLPEMVEGDLMANIACNEVGGRALLEFMDEYAIADLRDVSRAIIGHSERLMRAQLRAIPDGVYRNTLQIEGTDGPVTLAVAVNIKGDGAHLDFTGTGPVVKRGINVPLCYTRAFTLYALKCLLVPDVPNNEGSSNPVTLFAPENCILNAQPPWPTGGRHIFGHYVAPLINGALREALPSRVPAETGMLSQLNCQGRHRDDGRRISTIYFSAGGYGALDGFDGYAAVPAPSNMIGSPTEVFEQETSITVLTKRLLPDSGGAGRHPGGPGQEFVMRNDTTNPLQLACFAGRTQFASRGVAGGKDGALRTHRLNGEVVDSKGRYMLQPGDTMAVKEAGGAGFGDPKQRPVEALLVDLDAGHVTVDGVRRAYGVDLDVERKRPRVSAAD